MPHFGYVSFKKLLTYLSIANSLNLLLEVLKIMNITKKNINWCHYKRLFRFHKSPHAPGLRRIKDRRIKFALIPPKDDLISDIILISAVVREITFSHWSTKNSSSYHYYIEIISIFSMQAILYWYSNSISIENFTIWQLKSKV